MAHDSCLFLDLLLLSAVILYDLTILLFDFAILDFYYFCHYYYFSWEGNWVTELIENVIQNGNESIMNFFVGAWQNRFSIWVKLLAMWHKKACFNVFIRCWPDRYVVAVCDISTEMWWLFIFIVIVIFFNVLLWSLSGFYRWSFLRPKGYTQTWRKNLGNQQFSLLLIGKISKYF